jgi:alpha-tubulin suppressor-like RCC1 family protein
LVLLKNGTVLATGRNLHGQLGDGFATDVDRIRAAPVPGLSDVIAIAAGGDLSMALRADGSVWTWGDNRLGQLGIGSTDFQRDVPTKVGGLPTITAIAAGNAFGLALATNGELWAWGYNFSGELGDGTTVTSRNVPGKVPIAGKVTAMSGGLQHALALLDDGTVWAWGANVLGEVGVETQPLPLQQVRTPAQVSNLSGIREISAGYALSLAIDSNGDLWSWGGNLHGELGLGTKYNDPVNPGPRQYTTPQRVNLNLN